MRQLTIDDLHRLLLNQAANAAEIDPWRKDGNSIHGRLKLDVDSAVENRIVGIVLGSLTYRNREQIRRLIDRLANWPGNEKREIDLQSYWARIGGKYFDYSETFNVKPTLFETWRRQMHATDEDLPALAWLSASQAPTQRRRTMSPDAFTQWPTFIRGNDPQLYRELLKGFGCLHLHLSGAYPAPYFWVGLMNKRFAESTFVTNLGDEKLRGYHTVADVNELVNLVGIARQSRATLFTFVQGRTTEDTLIDSRGECSYLNTKSDNIHALEGSETDYAQRDVPNWSRALCPSLIGERYLLFRVLRAIELIKDEMIAERISRILWAYLVAKHRFLGTVQQAEGIAGFDYFEHTFRFTRWRSEGDDTRSGEEIGNFLQESGGLVKLELMVAPRENHAEYQRDISVATAILKRITDRQSRSTRTLCGEPRVGLVVHFLKDHGEALDGRRSSDGSAYLAYHHGVRDRISRQFEALAKHLDSSGSNSVSICGIDAANRELYCPPEVFAEVFRRAVPELRRRNQERTLILGRTFHVGEDFVHVGTGLRRIYEALVFLDLRPGDRLGHACALGIDPVRWSMTTQNVEMHLIDILDDSVFEAVLLRDSKTRTQGVDERRMSELLRLIDELCVEIFGATIPLVHLEKAWRMRADAPRNNEKSYGVDESIPAWVREIHRKFPPEIIAYRSAGSHSLAAQIRGNVSDGTAVPTDTAERIAAEYLHDIRTIRRFLTMRTVDATGSAGNISILQQLVAEEANARGIVVESNPSSNWLIGGLESHVEIPAVRFLLASGVEDGRVPFTINPDDPTVFASSIENEYFMVFSAAVHSARTITRSRCLREISAIRERSLQASFLD